MSETFEIGASIKYTSINDKWKRRNKTINSFCRQTFQIHKI